MRTALDLQTKRCCIIEPFFQRQCTAAQRIQSAGLLQLFPFSGIDGNGVLLHLPQKLMHLCKRDIPIQPQDHFFRTVIIRHDHGFRRVINDLKRCAGCGKRLQGILGTGVRLPHTGSVGGEKFQQSDLPVLSHRIREFVIFLKIVVQLSEIGEHRLH